MNNSKTKTDKKRSTDDEIEFKDIKPVTPPDKS